MPLLTAIFCALLAFQSSANEYGSATVSTITSIYDADTFRATIKGWPAVVGENIPIRLMGVDAPEIRGKCPEEKTMAQEAKAFTVGILESAERIELRNIQRGKYFRLLAEVYVDDQSLSELLVTAGLARSYDGGKRDDWCQLTLGDLS